MILTSTDHNDFPTDSIKLRPSIAVLVKATVKVIQYFGWVHFTVLTTIYTVVRE